MTYNIIQTGSAGNAVLINDSILIDIGVPWKKIEPYADRIKLVLTTHRHGDHFCPSTAKALHKQHPAIRWGCCEWMVGPLLEAGVDKRVIDVYQIHDWMIYENVIEPYRVDIMADDIPHNVPNCAYHIDIPGIERLFYATDCATLDGIEAKDYDLYLIEANHTRAEIEARIAAKRAAGEYAYEVEAMHNHLSQEQALDWLAANMGPESRYVFLHAHQDKERRNNHDNIS